MEFQQTLGGRIRNGIAEAGLLLVLPLAFYHGFAEQFSTPKFYLTKCLIISGLAVWALSWVWTQPRRRARFPLGLPLLIFSLTIVISCLMSPVPRFSLMEAEFALCGPAWVLLLASWEQGSSAVRRIAAWIGLAGGLVAGITLLQRFGLDPVLWGGYQVDWGSMVARMRLYSTFGNPNFVGGYLIGTIFAAMALALASKAPWARAVWAGFALMMLAAIVETGSRGAWLGLAGGLAAAAWIVLPKNEPDPTEIHAARSTNVFAAPTMGWPVAALALSLTERIVAQLYGRVYLWRFSWPMFWRHPMVGSGWGSYQLFYLEFQGKFLSAHPECVGYWTNNRLAHNDPLQLLLETGILGFAAFVWVLWKYGREALRVRRPGVDAWSRSAVAASVGGVTAILADSLFNYQFAVPPTYILLFTLLALPALLCRAGIETEGGSEPPLNVPARSHHGRLGLRIAASVVILAAPCGLLWQQTRELGSERMYQSASDFEDRANMTGAEDAFQRSVGLNDLNGRAHFGLSRVLYSRSSFAPALEEVLKGEQTYTDSHQEVLRGRILDQMGRNSEALAAYRHALWLDPTLTSIQEDIDRLNKSP